MVREVLSMYVETIYGKDAVIMSGRCPEKESVDNWAIIWAEANDYIPVEVPPRFNEAEYFFERNKQMVHYADEIIAFIPRGQLVSGTWNCINTFKKMGKPRYKVFDEDGKEWDR